MRLSAAAVSRDFEELLIPGVREQAMPISWPRGSAETGVGRADR